MDATTLRHGPDPSITDVVRVLLLLQGAFLLLSGLALFLFMAGNPASIPVAFGPALLLFVLAARFSPERRWTRRATVAIQVLVLVNLAVSALLGLAPAIDFTPNPVTLLTNLCLPVCVIHLVGRTRAQAMETALVTDGASLLKAA